MKSGQCFLVLCLLTLAKSVTATWSVPPSCTLTDFILNGCKTETQAKGDGHTSKGDLVTDCPPNVVFVVDGSDSVSPTGYRQALESLFREIRTVTQTLANTHIGVVLFSEVIQDIPLQARTPAEIEDLIRQIQSIPQPRRKTLISRALSRAREMLQDYSMIESRAYNGIKSGSVIVLLSDGQTDNRQQAIQEAKLAKDNGVLIISLSLENPDSQLLKYVSHVMQDHLKAVNWTSLVACPGRVLDPVQRGRKCRDFLVVVDGSDSVLRHEETVRQYLVHTALRYRLVNNAIGVNVYGTDSQIQSANTRIRLDDDKYDLAEKINLRLAFPTSGGTGTDRAIIQSVGMLNDDLREEPAALILIIDGPTVDPQATRTAYQNARNNNYTTIVIRVGTDLPSEELSSITGGDLTNTFSVNSFTDLFGVDFDSRICEACQTSCPSNARLTGQCGCTCIDPEFAYVASYNSCVRIEKSGCSSPCPSNAYRGSECSCVCLDGKRFNEATRLCDCPNVCPSTARQTEQCGCVCWDSSLVYNTSLNACVTPGCYQECPINARRTTNCGCQCIDSSLLYNTFSNQCVTPTCAQQCPFNAQRTGICGCQCLDSNLVYNSSVNQCVTRPCSQECPSNAQRTTNCGCQCWDSNLIYNNISNQCVTQTCSQQCPANAQRTANCGCQCWDSSLVYSSLTNMCVAPPCSQECPFNARRTTGCGCQCVDTNQVYNNAINQCVNPMCAQECPNSARRISNCGCQCVDSSQIYNNNTNQCVTSACARDCPSNARRAGNCDCQCFNISHVYNVNTNLCESVLSQCTRVEYSCENNQMAYKDCNGDCFCACSSGFAGTRCEIRLQAELCNDCYYDNGHYHAGVVGYCSLYVSCVPLDVPSNSTVRPTSFVPYIMSCPPGTFYITRPDGWKGCDYLSNGRCGQDQCDSLPIGARYVDNSACQSFWQCGTNRRLESKQCCPVGQRFDSRNSLCVVDSACPVTCGRNGTGRCTDGNNGSGDECPFDVNPNDPNEYFFKSRPADRLRCQATDIMNLTQCLCVLDPNPTTKVCKPVVDMNFDLPSSNIESNVPQITVGNAIAANFNGTGDVILKMFAGSGFWTEYFQINLRLYLNAPVSGGQRIAVVTNADCLTGESVSITMDERNFYFTVYQIENSQPAEIVIPYAGRTDRTGWINLTLIYRKVGDRFSFSGTVGDYTEVYSGTVPLTTYIASRTCALHLGQGYRYAGLVGYVDDFQVWRCDPKA